MIKSYFLSFFVLIFLAAGYVMNCSSEEVSAYAIWSYPAANRSTMLQYAQRSGGSWGESVHLAIKEGLHVTPVIAVDKKHTVWIIWVEQTADENILRYAVIRHKKMDTGRVQEVVGKEQSYAPAIMIDNQGTPWIAWSGVNGRQLADVFTSRWDGTGWTKPLMVNEKNQVPDITPIIGLEKNKVPWVSWFGFNAAHRYVQFVAKWLNGRWNVDKKTLESNNMRIFLKERMSDEIQFPDQARKRLMGAVFIDHGNEIQSISERFIVTVHQD